MFRYTPGCGLCQGKLLEKHKQRDGGTPGSNTATWLQWPVAPIELVGRRCQAPLGLRRRPAAGCSSSPCCCCLLPVSLCARRGPQGARPAQATSQGRGGRAAAARPPLQRSQAAVAMATPRWPQAGGCAYMAVACLRNAMRALRSSGFLRPANTILVPGGVTRCDKVCVCVCVRACVRVYVDM